MSEPPPAPAASDGFASGGSRDQTMTGGAGGFLPIDVSLLVPGPLRGFDLYKRVSGDTVLLCARDYPLKQRVLDGLREAVEQEQYLYIPAEQGPGLSQYVEATLQHALENPALGVERRSAILHDSARAIMADILANPRAPDAFRRGVGLANATVDFMIEEPGALRSMSALFSKDYYTYTHSVHVCVLGVSLYKYLISPNAAMLRRVGLGLLLHDVGKSLVDQAVLNKNGRLTDEEFEQMKAHSALGWEALAEQGADDDLVRQIVLYHHERMDGSGYPEGLEGPRLTEVARVAAVVDVYDALTTDRPYRKAMGHEKAMSLMAETMVPNHLDAEYFQAFGKMNAVSRRRRT